MEGPDSSLPSAERLGERLWNYLRLDHKLVRSDIILALGSHDLRVAERAAELFLEGLAPLVVMSGGHGNLTRRVWDEPEAVKFADAAAARGVPRERMLLETASTNTGENVRFSRRLLEERGIAVRTCIAVQKPYMERRAYATVRKQWPEVSVACASPSISYGDYPTPSIPRDRVIHVMVGDLQRVLRYPALGYQIEQEVPEDVLDAYRRLIAMGYTGHLLPEE